MKYLLLLLGASILSSACFCQSLTRNKSFLTNKKWYSVDNKSEAVSNELPDQIGKPNGDYFISKNLPLTQVPTADKVFIDFVGTGDIQKSISEGKEINANTGIGIIFERFASFFKRIQSFEFESYLTIFTTADTINADVTGGELTNRRNFSTYLLNPVSAKQSVYLNANLYFGYPLVKDAEESFTPKRSDLTGFGKFATIVSGLNARFIASNNVWRVSDTVRNLGGLYARFGVFHEIIPDNKRINENGRSKYSCYVGINYSYRGMYGDLSSKNNDEIRKRFLGTNKRKFSGLELDFGFRLNNLRAEFQMPMLSGKKFAVPGLTNTQFLFSIKFVGGFGLKLNESSNED